MTAVLLDQKNKEQEITQSEVQPVEAQFTHVTAFMVLIDNNGNVQFEQNINKPVVPQRVPTASEIKGALHVILDDINNQEGAMTTLAMMEIKAKQVQDQMANAAVLQQMGRMPR